MKAWKCLNKECGKIFYVTARILSKQPTQGFSLGSSTVSIEKACCPFCHGLEFEPVTAHLSLLAKEMREQMTNGWSASERKQWQAYLKTEVKPCWSTLYNFLVEHAGEPPEDAVE